MKKKYINDYIKEWKNDLYISIKKSSAETYISIYENIISPYFKNISLDLINDITCLEFQNYISNQLIKNKPFSNAYISLILVILKKILKYFYEQGYLSKITKIVNKSQNRQNYDYKMLTDFECAKLINYLSNKPNNKNFGIILGIYTGLRIGEICALRFEDLDLSNKLININTTLQRIKDKIYTSNPKTKTSFRTLPISNKLLDLIVKIENSSNDFYLLTNNSKPFEPRSFRRYFKKILDKNNLPDVTFHSLRHAFATRCIELGFDYKTVSELLGHSSVNTTLNLYVHPNLNTKRKYMEEFAVAF